MVAAIIVAAGRGSRMQERLRKQYLPLAGVPILVHTLEAVNDCRSVDGIYLVVPPDDFEYCRNHIISQLEPGCCIHLIAGGAHRQDSVYNGLRQLDANCRIVLIHDGVRPFVKNEQLTASIKGARQHGACILGIPAYDTMKRIDTSHNIVRTLSRDAVWLAQTPQTFRYDLIKRAYDRANTDRFVGTDDASLVERLGESVKIIHGSRSNIKITNKEDLKIAQALIKVAAAQSP